MTVLEVFRSVKCASVLNRKNILMDPGPLNILPCLSYEPLFASPRFSNFEDNHVNCTRASEPMA